MEKLLDKKAEKIGRRDVLKKAALVGAAGALFGCTKEKSSGPAVGSQKQYEWKMVTTWPKNFPGVGTGANFLAKAIEELSQGQIRVKVYGAGELVPALGIFDAVSRGTAELGHGAAYYWKGKHEATQFFAAVPFGMNATEMNGWIVHGGGQKLWDELYSQFGLKPFLAGHTGVQMGGWFKREIRTPKDLKGLKMRMPGLGGEVLRQLGSTVVTLPGGEIFQSLKSGAIDATEWVGPYNDLAFGFHQAAKFYYWPGWHEPTAALECMVNKALYEKLPKHLKDVLRLASEAATLDMTAEYTARNSSALETLVTKHKVQLRKFPDGVLSQIGKASKEVVQNIASKDPFSKKVFQSYNKFRQDSLKWDKVSEQGYSVARSLVFSG